MVLDQQGGVVGFASVPNPVLSDGALSCGRWVVWQIKTRSGPEPLCSSSTCSLLPRACWNGDVQFPWQTKEAIKKRCSQE